MRYFLILLLLLLGCQSKYQKSMLGGSVVQSDFHETIPFDFSSGLPIIKVKIEGEEYRFLFDTGAPNVISKELASKIAYKTISKPEIRDSQGGKAQQISVQLDSIQIGDIVFLDMAAILIDYKKVFQLGCIDFDGFIGANLMSKAFWEIDYEDLEISFTDQLERLDIPSEAYSVPFRKKYSQMTPEVKIRTGPIDFNKVTFDTGASGAISLVLSEDSQFLDSISQVQYKGTKSVGVYGDGGESINHYGVVDSLVIGDLEMYDQVVEYESKGAMTLGNRFLKEYRVILDWEKDVVQLIPYENGYSEVSYSNIGFGITYLEGKFVVAGLIKGSQAEELGLQLGSEILQINEYNLEKVGDLVACDLYNKKIMKDLDVAKIRFVKDSTVMEIELEKQEFIKALVKS